MYETGTVRRVDELGRVVIPAHLRRELHLEAGSEVNVTLTADRQCLVVQPKEPICVFCGKPTEEHYKGVAICPTCKDGVAKDHHGGTRASA